ncbi:hypothetical protein MAH1_18290 [Sessilibacter sp. MAH1]
MLNNSHWHTTGKYINQVGQNSKKETLFLEKVNGGMPGDTKGWLPWSAALIGLEPEVSVLIWRFN